MTFSPHRPLAFSKDQERMAKYIYEEIFVNEEYKVKLDRIDPIIFDCGANIGFASLYFLEQYPNATVLAFEPNPSAVIYFNQNTKELQKSGKITLHQIALGEENKIGHLYTTHRVASVLGSLIYEFDGHRIPVKVQKLSDFLAPYDRVDLVKIDIEGSEWAVTRDLVKSGCLNKIDNLIVEYHQMTGGSDTLNDFISEYKKVGFKVEIRRTIEAMKTGAMTFVCHVLLCTRIH